MSKIITNDYNACFKLYVEGYELSVAMDPTPVAHCEVEPDIGREFGWKQSLIIYKGNVDVTMKILGTPWCGGTSEDILWAIDKVKAYTAKMPEDINDIDVPSFVKRQACAPAPGMSYADHAMECERVHGCKVCGKKGCCSDDHSSKHITGLAAIALG